MLSLSFKFVRENNFKKDDKDLFLDMCIKNDKQKNPQKILWSLCILRLLNVILDSVFNKNFKIPILEHFFPNESK